MFKLIAQDGTEYPLTRPVTTIGREGSDVLLLQDDGVSRRHAKVEQRGDALVLVDLDSTNGTFVNGARLQAPHTLRSGDVIQIGGSSLTVHAEGEKATRVMREPPPMAVPPPPPQARQPAPVYAAPAGYARPPKDRSIAIILEILPGFFAFLGIGWIYAGQITTGVIILVTDIVFNCIFAVIGTATAGITFCLTLPLQLAAVGLSTYLLYQHTKKRPDLFGP
ncbi:MAG: FHA domain-containing protein [Chloroflexota bacterium]|nr:FHA domain-containing protein [Chloroflexota bacterium]